MERLAGAFADAVVTVHEPYRRELVARGARDEKVTVVMNSVDERLLPRPTPTATRPFRVVYHGTVTPSYGVHLLVEAAAQIVPEVGDLSVEIIGEGDAIAAIRQRARQLGVSAQLAMDGTYVEHREALARVNGASVGVVPNLPSPLNRFALSSKLFEYVALGVPVVCASLPTIRQHFADDEILYFEPGDPQALAEALLAVHRDPGAAAERARRAASRYAAYRWEANARTYVAVLDRVARREGPA
jgi:glycosyltransferase involved in cell wall biosynthesis